MGCSSKRSVVEQPREGWVLVTGVRLGRAATCRIGRVNLLLIGVRSLEYGGGSNWSRVARE